MNFLGRKNREEEKPKDEKPPELVPGFKGDPETDDQILFELAQTHDDARVAEIVETYRLSDSRTLDEYLAPYINAYAEKRGMSWFGKVFPTNSPEIYRYNAARRIAHYLSRKRESEGPTLH